MVWLIMSNTSRENILLLLQSLVVEASFWKECQLGNVLRRQRLSTGTAYCILSGVALVNTVPNCLGINCSIIRDRCCEDWSSMLCLHGPADGSTDGVSTLADRLVWFIVRWMAKRFRVLNSRKRNLSRGAVGGIGSPVDRRMRYNHVELQPRAGGLVIFRDAVYSCVCVRSCVRS